MAPFEDDRTRKQDQATAEAFADPQPGDRFQEMWSWWIVVLSAGAEGVKELKPSDARRVMAGVSAWLPGSDCA